MKKYAAVRTDNMIGTKVGSYLVSLRYPQEIENGSVLVIGALEDGSREVRTATAPAASTPLNQLALIASEEIVKDVKIRDVDEFVNLPNSVLRGYRFGTNDIFSVSPMALADDSIATPAVGNFACIASNTKIRLVATATGTTIGRVIAVETGANGENWIVIQVQ